MLTLNEIKDVLKDRNLAEVSRLSGISYPRLRRAVAGGDPPYSVVKAISDYIEARND